MSSNLLKSIFISVYAAYIFAGALTALLALQRGFDLAWSGAALAHLPMAVLFSRLLLLKNLPRSHRWLPTTTALTATGAVIAAYGFFANNSVAGVMGIVALVGYLIYLLWYSQFSRSPAGALQPGRKLPDFSAVDSTGDSFSPADLAGRPAVLLFFRGNWCPLCMAQVREIAASYRQLAERDIEVVLISSQSPEKTARLARRFDAPMRFVVDRNNAIARQLGIAWQHALPFGMQLLGYRSESVLPTAIVIDSAGRIVLADQTDNYRIRPEPATFIAALEESVG
ncbi:MAG: peroxiredoxin family protein [Gammaproteobacteria bacterium]|nr:peroxiredoxin family protein [Gammaproteobacteria bacterium]NNF61365.1 redoxin domain-containing protein [Gammaproteobacteria bacterium]